MFGSMVGPEGGEGVSGAVVGGCGSRVGAVWAPERTSCTTSGWLATRYLGLVRPYPGGTCEIFFEIFNLYVIIELACVGWVPNVYAKPLGGFP